MAGAKGLFIKGEAVCTKLLVKGKRLLAGSRYDEILMVDLQALKLLMELPVALEQGVLVSNPNSDQRPLTN